MANGRGGLPFREADVQLAEAFAEQAAVALEVGRAELQRLAVLEDRERIAKELHDGAIQALFAVGMGLQGSAVIAGSEEPAWPPRTPSTSWTGSSATCATTSSACARGSWPISQFDQALQRLVEEPGQRTGVVAIAEIDPAAAAELTGRAGDLVQLAREAPNVSRHAAATTCRVSLYLEGDAGVLEVDDDGHGFDPAKATGGGHGLATYASGARALGGQAEIASAPGEGTRVRVTVPR